MKLWNRIRWKSRSSAPHFFPRGEAAMYCTWATSSVSYTMHPPNVSASSHTRKREIWRGKLLCRRVISSSECTGETPYRSCRFSSSIGQKEAKSSSSAIVSEDARAFFSWRRRRVRKGRRSSSGMTDEMLRAVRVATSRKRISCRTRLSA